MLKPNYDQEFIVTGDESSISQPLHTQKATKYLEDEKDDGTK